MNIKPFSIKPAPSAFIGLALFSLLSVATPVLANSIIPSNSNLGSHLRRTPDYGDGLSHRDISKAEQSITRYYKTNEREPGILFTEEIIDNLVLRYNIKKAGGANRVVIYEKINFVIPVGLTAGEARAEIIAQIKIAAGRFVDIPEVLGLAKNHVESKMSVPAYKQVLLRYSNFVINSPVFYKTCPHNPKNVSAVMLTLYVDSTDELLQNTAKLRALVASFTDLGVMVKIRFQSNKLNRLLANRLGLSELVPYYADFAIEASFSNTALFDADSSQPLLDHFAVSGREFILDAIKNQKEQESWLQKSKGQSKL
jgi:hypothetical protein